MENLSEEEKQLIDLLSDILMSSIFEDMPEEERLSNTEDTSAPPLKD